jgi:hypothetical protein
MPIRTLPSGATLITLGEGDIIIANNIFEDTLMLAPAESPGTSGEDTDQLQGVNWSGLDGAVIIAFPDLDSVVIMQEYLGKIYDNYKGAKACL